MDLTLVLIMQVMFQTTLSGVLLTVETEQSLFESEFGGEVVMGCSFQPKPSKPEERLTVKWNWISSSSSREVYRMQDGKEVKTSQDPDYKDRVTLLEEELAHGWAKLKVSSLRISDSGTYQCVVQTKEGADYKDVTLSVTGPYKTITKQIQKSANGDEVLLSCESEGYPKSSVMWLDGDWRKINSSTTAVSMPTQLFKVTSEIRVPSGDKNNYTCRFTDGPSATFHIPEKGPSPLPKNDAYFVLLAIALVVFVVALLIYTKRKVFRTSCTRNPSAVCLERCVHIAERSIPFQSGPRLQGEMEEKNTMLNEASVEENLGAQLKGHYSDLYLSADAKHRLDTFAIQELHQSLQNNEGQAVSLQALLPEAGEILYLEGPPRSGKTTVAHILVSSWCQGPTHALANLLDLSAIQLLVHVDCSRAKGDLFQEIMTQLLLPKISGEELWTVLIRSEKVLLLLDGYREGNQLFDESLTRFLSARKGCRVLVTACPGHLPALRDTAGTKRVLELQTQTATGPKNS